MFGTISESEMRRRTENVGLSVQSVRLEGGDVTRAFIPVSYTHLTLPTN